MREAAPCLLVSLPFRDPDREPDPKLGFRDREPKVPLADYAVDYAFVSPVGKEVDTVD